MTDWRTLAAIPSVAVLVGLAMPPAAAQSPADPPGTKLEAQHETQTETDRPQSPEEEIQLRRARLDSLFAQLALADGAGWQSVQDEIWALWSQSGSDSMDLLLLRAARAMEAQEFELALRFLNDLVRLAPDFAEGWNKRATVCFLLGEYGNSVADIEHTLALEPRHFGALSGLGMILERTGNKEGAMRVYRKGLEIHPHLPGAVQGVERLAPDVDG